MYVVFDGIGKHVREHRCQEDEVEAPVREWKSVRGGGHNSVWIVCTACHIGAMKPKIRLSWRDGPLAPRDGFGVNVDTVVTTVEIAGQTDREIANAGSDVENPVLRP